MNKSKIVNAGSSTYKTINPKYWVDLNLDSGGGDSTKLQEELDEARAMLDELISRTVTEIRSNATIVGIGAFQGCSSLTAVDLPAATSVDTSAFAGCPKLTKLILRSDMMCMLANTGALSSTPISSGTGYIYVPAALIDDYKVATNWSTFAAQFRALEDYTVDGTTAGELDESKI